MRSTVERGTARCPRCGHSADYAFATVDSGSLWYEVQCSGCGHTHTEETGMVDIAA